MCMGRLHCPPSPSKVLGEPGRSCRLPTTPTPERWALGITASSGRTAVVTQRQGGTHSGGAPCQLPGLPTPRRTQRTWRAGTGAPLFPTKKPTAHRNTRINFFIQAPSVQQTPPRLHVRASLHPWLHPAHQCSTRPHPLTPHPAIGTPPVGSRWAHNLGPWSSASVFEFSHQRFRGPSPQALLVQEDGQLLASLLIGPGLEQEGCR